MISLLGVLGTLGLVLIHLATPTPEVIQIQPDNDPKYQLYSLLVNFALVVATILSMLVTLWMSRKRSEAEHKLEYAREHIRKLTLIDYVYQEVILLGPRASGKTSVAKLWTKAWCDITEIPPTQAWETYEASIYEINTEKKYDPKFDMERKHLNTLRIKVHDYPGEDNFRTTAVKRIPELKNVVLLLFFDFVADSTGILPTDRNNNYYSKAFMETVERQSQITLNIAKVFVVFNKIDKLPPEIEIDSVKQRLHEVNKDALKRVESLFSGKLEYFYVSALDNRKLISLLGAAGSMALEEEEKKKFDEQIKKLAMETK